MSAKIEKLPVGQNVISVKLQFERETKGAVRFQEVDDAGNPKDIAAGAVIGTLYLRKSGINGIPKGLTVNIIPE